MHVLFTVRLGGAGAIYIIITIIKMMKSRSINGFYSTFDVMIDVVNLFFL